MSKKISILSIALIVLVFLLGYHLKSKNTRVLTEEEKAEIISIINAAQKTIDGKESSMVSGLEITILEGNFSMLIKNNHLKLSDEELEKKDNIQIEIGKIKEAIHKIPDPAFVKATSSNSSSKVDTKELIDTIEQSIHTLNELIQ